MSQTKIDVVIERLDGLAKLVEVYSQLSHDGYEKVNTRLKSVDGNLYDLNVKVGIQNGRVTRLEKDTDKETDKLTELIRTHALCPGIEMEQKFQKHEESDNTRWEKVGKVLIIANSWRTIVASVFILSLSIGIVISKFPRFMIWIKETVIPFFEVGI